MVPPVHVDEATYRALEFAARMACITPGEVVARLVAAASTPGDSHGETSEQREPAQHVAVFADYEGHRTHAQYEPTTRRVDITSGPLTGKKFKTPTGAARAVVGHYKPTVSPNRNGWSFWTLDDGSGDLLQKIRY